MLPGRKDARSMPATVRPNRLPQGGSPCAKPVQSRAGAIEQGGRGRGFGRQI